MAVAHTGSARPALGRTLVAGVVGGIAMNVVMLLTFRLLGFGWDGGGFLLDPARQSPKLIAVWTELEPLPRIVAEPGPMVLGLLLFAVGHAFIYRWLAPTWPPGTPARALRMSGLLFLVCFLFWEFFTPFNLFGEPVSLIAVELLFWGAIALAEGFAIAGVAEGLASGGRGTEPIASGSSATPS